MQSTLSSLFHYPSYNPKAIRVISVELIIDFVFQRCWVVLRQNRRMIGLIAHLPHIFPAFSVPNVARQVLRQDVYPALLVIVLTWKIGKGLFPAFDIDNITGKMIGFIFPAVQIILLAVEFGLKLSLPTVDICNFALVIQVKLAVLLVHIKSFIMFL